MVRRFESLQRTIFCTYVQVQYIWSAESRCLRQKSVVLHETKDGIRPPFFPVWVWYIQIGDT